jgi:hypothetical protein
MTGLGVFRRRNGALALLVCLGGLAIGPARAANPNERDVKPQANVLDKDDIASPDSKIWALEFHFKDPRVITVDVPGRGRRVCWYLWYQVINRTKEPHTFIPDFELVTLDKNAVHRDQVLPRVQEAVREIEDPTGRLNIKNSVTIAAEPIPPTLPNAAPRPVTGVAIWDDVDPDTNRFSIFVSGLSNGWAITDPIPPDKEPVVRRKTLELNFKRLGDRFYQDSREIQFIEPPQWIYRASHLKLPAMATGGQGGKKEGKEEKKDETPAPKKEGS